MQIKRADGTIIEDPDELKEEFKEQFTPSVPKPVDMSILNELPQWEVRPFAPISPGKLLEILRTRVTPQLAGRIMSIGCGQRRFSTP